MTMHHHARRLGAFATSSLCFSGNRYYNMRSNVKQYPVRLHIFLFALIAFISVNDVPGEMAGGMEQAHNV
jgi:hypothetical protein